MMQEGGVILDIVLFVGICFVFGVFDLEIYFWCVVGCYSSTSRKSGKENRKKIKTAALINLMFNDTKYRKGTKRLPSPTDTDILIY